MSGLDSTYMVAFFVVFCLFFLVVPASYAPSDLLAPWPAGLRYECVNGNFGATHDIPFTYYAWDFEMPIGSEVLAASRGRVDFCGVTGTDGYGEQVRIKHPNGSYTLYAHLSAHAVYRGQQIRRGDVIGFSGNTGYSFTPHLHFAVIDRGNLSYPAAFLDIGIPVENGWYVSKNRRYHGRIEPVSR
ncbi:M23 family metallopeptidase [Tumebacillus permanentifrigoris]|uniref:Peptidase M23-like protein n=1 Tax=Tumebacillus permanentifrigoris TaxID=378543 RepID=A0A316DVF0_9BACL|nr:M23 family metallopeptidase [Tumebacillus permanentifrigoris]PWK13172.1 peptidase M23-like protein [Tumebacillus permanentifrigoris]